MIIKLHKDGRSFAGVCKYLTHDANRAETTERVAWTHTLNLAHDDVASAVNEMLWTSRSADLLKREAGVSTGGSKLERPVKHFSLSWPHGTEPSKEHMIETARAYMAHMGWADRQAVLVAHNDTKHHHAHVVMNSVSPEDGRAVRSSNDWRRTEAFALQYERDRGQIHCEQRLKPQPERDATPTREGWQRLKKSEIAFERTEVERLTKAPSYFERHDDKVMNSREWDALKAYQKNQREQFFMGGKKAFREVRNDVFREVREEFRGQWNAYYAALRGGHSKSSLAATKLALTSAQNKALDERRQVACDHLRETRDHAYDRIRAQQKVDRAELTLRQQQGLRTYLLMDVVHPASESAPIASAQEKLKKQSEKASWTVRQGGPAPAAVTNEYFGHAGRYAVDPSHEAEDPYRRPYVAQSIREAAPTAPTSRPAERTTERTEASVERERTDKAREMTDQTVTMGRAGEVAALRASWNRSRRSRGGRD
jgi:hypothetical protein